MKKYGLIGRGISYSFSQGYFNNKFDLLGIDAHYQNFDCKNLDEVQKVLQDTAVSGYNVTIPYKQEVMAMIDGLHPDASTIGAVNTIKRTASNSLIGYNTDFIGFRDALFERFPLGEQSFEGTSALVLGTGGASKAVEYALKAMGVRCQYVSRKRTDTHITYADLDAPLLKKTRLIVNCTPLGTSPNIQDCPAVPYHLLSKQHIAYDLIYNPFETEFLKRAKAQGAATLNGLRMLELQAEAAWHIWNMP